MGLFGGYENAGPGIAKNAPKKKRIIVFFEIFVRKFWKLLEVNVLYMLFCLPIVTIGPATAALTKITRNFSLEKHAFIWGDFWESFKKNFKQSFFIGIANVILLTSTVLGCIIYPEFAIETGNKLWYFMFIITLSIGITILMMDFYIFPMIVATDISTKNILKNAFFLTCLALKQNILTLVISLVIMAAFIIFVLIYPAFMILLLFMPASIVSLIICFNCYPVIQKYVINPYYEQRGEINPELIVGGTSGEETLFDDMGGSEKPIKVEKKKKKIKTKNKTIS